MWSMLEPRPSSFVVYLEFEFREPHRSRSSIQLLLLRCANRTGVWNHPAVLAFVSAKCCGGAVEKRNPAASCSSSQISSLK